MRQPTLVPETVGGTCKYLGSIYYFDEEEENKQQRSKELKIYIYVL